jgi:hypothetical protein
MRSECVSLTPDELETILLPKLRGHVFHVTTPEGYAGILRDQFVGSNANGQYALSHSQSRVSYFRKRDCVSVVDLRAITDEDLRLAILKYYFLDIFPNHKSVFLILKQQCYSELVPWTVSKGDEGLTAMIVPYLEAGFKHSIPFDCIEKAILVEVADSPETSP